MIFSLVYTRKPAMLVINVVTASRVQDLQAVLLEEGDFYVLVSEMLKNLQFAEEGKYLLAETEEFVVELVICRVCRSGMPQDLRLVGGRELSLLEPSWIERLFCWN